MKLTPKLASSMGLSTILILPNSKLVLHHSRGKPPVVALADGSFCRGKPPVVAPAKWGRHREAIPRGRHRGATPTAHQCGGVLDPRRDVRPAAIEIVNFTNNRPTQLRPNLQGWECEPEIYECPSQEENECHPELIHCPSSRQCEEDLYQCPTRGEIEEILDIPYIISPRRTYLLKDRPSFEWNAVEEATLYTLSLLEIDEAAGTFRKLWSQSSTETAIDYPADAPALKPGAEYLLMVETDTGVSSQTERIPGGVGFRLLDTDRIQAILTDLVQIEEQNLDATAEALAIASLFVENGAIAAAVQHLEDAAASRMATAPVYAGLGRLYGDFLALPRQASEFDCRAIELADETQSQIRDAALERLERFGRTCEGDL